jgi:arylsulfatase A-like enzyme
VRRSRPGARAGLLRLLALGLLAGCSPPVALAPAIPLEARRHVVVISIDGLPPEAIEAAGARNLQRLMAEGAHALEARTILPSRTLPSHASMLTGVDVPAHGIDWNTDRVHERGLVRVPTVFGIAREAGLTTGAAIGKSKFRHLLHPGSLDRVSVPRGGEVWLSPEVTQTAVQMIRHSAPDLLFVHLSDPDIAGHGFGWMSPPYRWAVRRADAAVGRIVRAARARFGDGLVVIVTSDHGGHGRTHGSDAEADVRIPWIAWGAAVEPGPIEAPVRTYDTAATALWLLGVPIPPEWDGAPVTSAFGAVATSGAPGAAREPVGSR